MGDKLRIKQFESNVKTLNSLNKEKSLKDVKEKWKEAVKDYTLLKDTYDYDIFINIPYDEYGGIRSVVLTIYNQLTSGDAVREAIRYLELPEENSYYEDENTYGIIKVKKKGKFKSFESIEVEKIVRYILKHYYQQEYNETGRSKIIENREEILNNLKRKYGLWIKEEKRNR